MDRTDANGNVTLPGPAEAGRKDVVKVYANEKVRFIRKFDKYNNDVPYMYHCHINVHEDKGMMQQFIVENSEIYIDKNFSGTENGSWANPFNTFLEAYNVATYGSNIYFKSFEDHEIISPILINKRVKIKPLNGPITIK